MSWFFEYHCSGRAWLFAHFAIKSCTVADILTAKLLVNNFHTMNKFLEWRSHFWGFSAVAFHKNSYLTVLPVECGKVSFKDIYIWSFFQPSIIFTCFCLFCFHFGIRFTVGIQRVSFSLEFSTFLYGFLHITFHLVLLSYSTHRF